MSAIEDQLAQLRHKFRQRALEDAGAVERLATALEDPVAVEDTHEQVRRVAHKLAGAAGTFGFSSIGDCAAQLEDLAISGEERSELAEACRTVAAQIRLAIEAGGN